MTRLLSHTEISSALTCWARWDFKYGGRLAGTTLKPKALRPGLSAGRAWGAAVACWHQQAGELTALWNAHLALRASLDADADAMREAGLEPHLDELVETENRLGQMLDHYAATTVPIPNLTRLEGEIVVAIPARSGKRRSTRYRFQCFLDGFTDESGQRWLVEFKLRTRLTDPGLLERQSQQRWYAWAQSQIAGGPVLGVIMDERLNEVPKAARLTEKGKKPSHTKDQLTTPDRYIDLCHEHDVEPKAEVVEHLRQRRWQQRFPLMYDQEDLDEAGVELVSAAKLIRDLDSGELTPIRNAWSANCNGCDFKAICANPQDDLYVDSLFDRTVPKRLRLPLADEIAQAEVLGIEHAA